jgi:hypothetical protein
VSILRDSSIENAQKISGRVKIGMMVTLIGFGVGSPFLLSLF